jgi:hypothetical protein
LTRLLPGLRLHLARLRCHASVLGRRLGRRERRASHRLRLGRRCRRVVWYWAGIDADLAADRVLPTVRAALQFVTGAAAGVGPRSRQMGLLVGPHFTVARLELLDLPLRLGILGAGRATGPAGRGRCGRVGASG